MLIEPAGLARVLICSQPSCKSKPLVREKRRLGETAHMRNLACAFAARRSDKYQYLVCLQIYKVFLFVITLSHYGVPYFEMFKTFSYLKSLYFVKWRMPCSFVSYHFGLVCIDICFLFYLFLSGYLLALFKHDLGGRGTGVIITIITLLYLNVSRHFTKIRKLNS